MRISQLLKCRHDIIQGAMGIISNPEMVAAVSEAGGFGLIATGFMQNSEVLKRQLEAVKKMTNKPFGANLTAFNPASEKFIYILADYGVQAVTVSAGSPKRLVPILKEHRIKSLQVVGNCKDAVKAEEMGVDAVIAEGSESGGMQGKKGASTMVLVPTVIDAVKIPVVAAGGIGDSRGYRAAMELGAKGVQIGTRLIASCECIAHESYKKAICQAKETDTLLLPRDERFIRVIRNQIAEDICNERRSLPFPSPFARIESAWIKGKLGLSPLPAGQVCGIIDRIRTVREIIEEMVGKGC